MRRGWPRVALWVWALTGAPALVHAQVQPPASVTPAPEPPPVPATGSFSGTVTDALTKQVLPDAYVTIAGKPLREDRLAVTDASGAYRVGALPPGTYSVRIQKAGYREYQRPDILLVADGAATVNAELVPEGEGPGPGPGPVPVPEVPRPPVVDPSKGSTGGSLGPDSGLVRTGERFSAGRSLELLPAILPGARLEPLGLALSGGSPLEKRVLVDGVSASDPATGALLFPLSLELVDSMDVLTGGYLPEHGRSASGTILVETRSGSNEWHGAVYGQWAPGGLEGARAQAVPRLSSLRLSQSLWNQGDLGAQLSGPLIKDRLWLFLGVQGASERLRLTRRIFQYQLVTDPGGSGLLVHDLDPATGEERAQEVDGSAQSWFADSRQLQYAARLTWLPDVDRTFSLSVAGTPSQSGGPGRFGYDPLTGAVMGWKAGGALALQRATSSDARLVVLRGSSTFWDRQLTVDAALGWYHSRLVVSGAAEVNGVPQVLFRNGALPGPHGLDDFEAVMARAGDPLAGPVVAACFDGPGQAAGVRHCPVPELAGGGAGALGRDLQDRIHARAVGTYLANILGHHVARAGAELELLRLDRLAIFTGGAVLREGDPDLRLDDFRAFGTLGGSGPVRFGGAQTVTGSVGAGAFVQDAWHLLDLLQVNIGVRWDGQQVTAPDGGTALALWNQLSPRAGLVFDFSGVGKSKVYGSYARYIQAVPLEVVQRAFGGEQHVLARRAAGGACDVTDPDAWLDPLRCESTGVVIDAQGYGATRPPVDSRLQPTTVDELLAGLEYEVLPDVRAGASYTHRTLVRSLRAVSLSEGRDAFFANPGFGLGDGVDQAVRDYDAITVSLDRAFAAHWMAQASYTLSWLRGNEDGVFEPFTSWSNRSGPLPGDRTHAVKLFGGKEFELPGSSKLMAGGAYLAESGGPTSVLGSHEYFGDGAVFIFPRGSGPRLPWTHSVDLHLALQQPLPSGLTLHVSLDAFNVLNFQAVTAIDERYTLSDAAPQSCRPCTDADLAGVTTPGGQPAVPNPSFRRPTAYQLPRTVRFGAKLSF